MEKTAFDPASRRLCPDGNCIGLIGPDGRCKECGRSSDGKPAALVGKVASQDTDDTDNTDDGDDTGDGDARDAAAPEAKAGAFDPKRKLCPDGNCTGVLGADGVCPECGQRAE
jgi:hypothetical protein